MRKSELILPMLRMERMRRNIESSLFPPKEEEFSLT